MLRVAGLRWRKGSGFVFHEATSNGLRYWITRAKWGGYHAQVINLTNPAAGTNYVMKHLKDLAGVPLPITVFDSPEEAMAAAEAYDHSR
jgi:hypothetical protein